jgi:hypothetical protein
MVSRRKGVRWLVSGGQAEEQTDGAAIAVVYETKLQNFAYLRCDG